MYYNKVIEIIFVRYKNMKIGVVGLGLIGGSIFKDLTCLNYDVVGVSQSQKGENIYSGYEVLKNCDIVFVCSAMNKTLAILDKLENFVQKDTIVTDVCSLKRFVSVKKYSYNFIPSHPMAGTEHKGFENSFEGLFKGAKWVITSACSDVPKVFVEVIKKMGAVPVYATAEEHDRAVALISHMPMLISQAIFKTAQDNELALEIASSGFRDMTRLALSNTEMANDMINMNADNIEKSLLELYKSVGELTKDNYISQIEQIKSKRNKMFQ